MQNLKNQLPVVSVIMASYNHEKFVETAVRSVLNQTYQNFEFLIGDDASNDKTPDIIKSIAKEDSRIKFTAFKTNREVHIRNYMLNRAKGQYIAIINSDDEFLPDKLEKQIEIFNKKKNIGLVLTNPVMIDEFGQELSGTVERNRHYDEVISKPRDKFEMIKFLVEAGNRFIHSSAMFRTSLIKDLGGYNELLGLSSDYDLWMKFSINSEIYLHKDYLTKVRIISGSANMGSANVGNMNRKFFEFVQIFDELIDDRVLKNLSKIFPEIIEDTSKFHSVLQQYVLCMYLFNNNGYIHKYFAQNHIYKLLKNDQSRKIIERHYGKKLFADFFKNSTKLELLHAPQQELKIYSGEKVDTFLYKLNEEKEIKLELADSTKANEIVINPMNSVGTFVIESMKVKDAETNRTLWKLDKSQFTSQVKLIKFSTLLQPNSDNFIICHNGSAEISIKNIDNNGRKFLLLKFKAISEIPELKLNNQSLIKKINNFVIRLLRSTVR